ncbi:related to C6 transcription factor [Rhynchosporium graminicola]|uniref:Related to C6 transcription factor n=1 Tax=Rhynchosporium graminicola TaxID=2792576 RepID=A0A1E1LEV6_9HELO|nr:related to C6 transcription factor [Rhynchosporium commune]
MSSERPAKRIRQACDPCRRKKSRCPGEKPVCSHCARLQQNCYYADERPENDRVSVTPSPQVAQHRPTSSVTGDGRVEDRLSFLENKLSEVLANQTSLSRSASVQVSKSPRRAINHEKPSPRSSSDRNLPPWNVILGAAELYLQYCDCQPLPLFQRSSFIRTLRDRRPEILFSILAIALRFTEDTQSRNAHLKAIDGYVEAARTIISKQVFDGTVELSTIQALCLLTVVDFTDGHTRRASIHCSLAMSLAHNASLTSEPPTTLPASQIEERRRCFWSLSLVKRLHGADFMVLDFSAEDNFPWYPSTTSKPLSPGRECTAGHQSKSARNDEQGQVQGPDKGIVAYAIQLSEVWFKITRYARRRGKPSSLPPWSSQSEYATILAHQMDFETRMPFKHRFEPAKFSQRSIEHLSANRDYWGPWLFIQFLYHTNLCLLNHPLLLSLRLRNFKCVIPEIFLQHTSELICSHASWVINFIDMLASKEFRVTDPFLGHCVAIIATIYLQESFVDDPGTRSEKQGCFEKCLTFIHGFGEQWPHLSRIATKLQTLSSTVSSTYVASEEATRQNRKLLIDLVQFFEVLEYSSSSELLPSSSPITKHQLFGPSLQSAPRVEKGSIAQTQTSVLPMPTRVERQEFGNSTPTPGMVHGPESESESELREAGAEYGVGSGLSPDTSMGNGVDINAGAGMAALPLVYSDDELAVLAESFFHQGQRNDYDGTGTTDWWNQL